MSRRKRWQPPHPPKPVLPQPVCPTGQDRFGSWEAAHAVLVTWSVRGLGLHLSRWAEPCDECRGWHLVLKRDTDD